MSLPNHEIIEWIAAENIVTALAAEPDGAEIAAREIDFRKDLVLTAIGVATIDRREEALFRLRQEQESVDLADGLLNNVSILSSESKPGPYKKDGFVNSGTLDAYAEGTGIKRAFKTRSWNALSTRYYSWQRSEAGEHMNRITRQEAADWELMGLEIRFDEEPHSVEHGTYWNYIHKHMEVDIRGLYNLLKNNQLEFKKMHGIGTKIVRFWVDYVNEVLNPEAPLVYIEED